MMSRRLAQRKRAPGFIHLPPPPPMPLSRPVSTSSCSPLQQLNPTSGHAGPHDSSTEDVVPPLTQPVSIPAASSVHQRVSSPYYSPSQIFPTSAANKSYFPAYLSQSISSAASSRPSSPLLQHHHPNQLSQHQQQQASTPSPSASTPSPPPPPPPLNIPPRTPRSPSFFGAVPSPLSQSSHPHPHPQSQAQSQAPSMSVTSSARTPGPSARTYHAHLAQQQLAFQMQQRDLIFQSTRATSSASGPISPRLIPLGSPGPVTPLTLEDNPAGYISASLLSPALQLQQHHLEKLAAAAEKAAAEEDPKSS